MKVSILFESGNNNYHIPTLVYKEGVETTEELAYLFSHAAKAAGFDYIQGVILFAKDGKEYSSEDIMSMSFKEVDWD